MNVNDVEKPTEEVEDRLVEMFNKQHSLMSKYIEIERKSGCLVNDKCPVDLNSATGQFRIKDFFWRMIEEVGEALDAMSHNNEVHAKEELADGIHFLIEATFLAGMDKKILSFFNTSVAPAHGPKTDRLDKAMLVLPILDMLKTHVDGAVCDLIQHAGMTCNCLKNKPWKQSQMLTDLKALETGFIYTWMAYINLCLSVMNGPHEIYEYYFRKNQVNQFRQRSNY